MQKGFTLVELLVALSVFVIVFVLVILFALRFVQVTATVRVQRSSAVDAKAALDHILLEVRQGNSLYTPTTDTVGALGQLSIETGQHLPPNEMRTYVDFYVDNGILVKKREGENPTPLTSETTRVARFDVDDVSLINRDAVRVLLEIEQRVGTTPERQQTVLMVGTASFRNQ